MNPLDFVVLLSTCPDAGTTARIARTLVEGETEAVALAVEDGHDAYLRWVQSSAQSPPP